MCLLVAMATGIISSAFVPILGTMSILNIIFLSCLHVLFLLVNVDMLHNVRLLHATHDIFK